ncbi:MAG: L-threonylcarbamoyladenylate synthase [Acidobacteria bacterium]|nr:L-threonylcarbamoyladenylate synthase [Acidobacteriota bacterium]MDA1234130.1 L-threonylcarbamoyladenylate synthase [Acidobacteriota bacterium]
MRTEIIETPPDGSDDQAIEQAAEAILAGRIVALPSESGYVLAADPFNLSAIAAVFRAKGRELHRALPILVDSLTMAEDYAADSLSPQFLLLARRFWPGPLTIITAASRLLPMKITGNSGRLAVRQDSNAVANRLIERLERPIIATSANRSGHSTCRSGIEVFGTMDGRVHLILNAGEADRLPATTVDITSLQWSVIKEGAITEAQLDDCLSGA